MDPKISKPCPASWDAMTGDQQSRHCDKCNKSVHNICELSAAEAEALLCKSTTSVCIRMQQTKDGAFKTKSGWMKRVALAGAAGLTLIPMTGCDSPQAMTGDLAVPTTQSTSHEPNPTVGKVVMPNPENGEVAPPDYTVGDTISPQPTNESSVGILPPATTNSAKTQTSEPVEPLPLPDDRLMMLGSMTAPCPPSALEEDGSIIEITTRQENSDKPE